MSDLALQQDLFATEPDLPIARLNPHNERCLLHEDCHWDEHQVDRSTWWRIGVGRTAEGYYWTHGFCDNHGGSHGPVFIRPNPAPDFQSARRAAVEGLLFRLNTVYDEHSKAARKRLANHVQACMTLSS